MTAQTSLQQSTYKNTADVHEVARDIQEVTKDTHEVSRNIDQTTKGIAENTAGIDCKTTEIAVSIVRGTVAVGALMFLTGSHGPRNLGQTRSRAQGRIPG